MAWLQRLVDATRDRLEAGFYDQRPDQPLEPIGSLRDAIQRAYPAIVAEIKPGRPTTEPRPVDVAATAQAYADGGACAISVLTDPDHFGGSLENLDAARAGHRPLLMKDFALDPRQVDAGAAWGASAILVIARLHTEGYTDTALHRLIDHAHDQGLEVLAEAVTEAELDACLTAGADVIGINVRDLDTLELDPARPARLIQACDPQVPVLHLSGIQTTADVAKALGAGARGVLVGTSLMAADDPRQATRALTEVAR